MILKTSPFYKNGMEDVALKRLVRELEKIRGTGTQLISLYIPPGYPRGELSSMLTDEYGKAGNIKDKSTRKNVQAALQKIMVYLKAIDYRIPETGLVIFCGNISPNPGESDIRLYSVVPPQPVPKIYRCDSTFYLEPLKEMLKPTEYYGILVLDGKEATIAVIKGNTYDIVARIRSLAGGKHRAGGQSARRFERLRELAVHEYHKKIAEVMKEVFEEMGDKLKGIVVGGPGPHKHEFLNKGYLPENIRRKIIGIVDTGYTDEYGIREAMEAAKDILREAEIMQMKKVFQRFFSEVVKGGLADYGLQNIYEDLKEGKVDTLLVLEDAEAWIGKYVCPQGHELEIVAPRREDLERRAPKCPVCGQPMSLAEVRDAVEEFIRMAEETGAKVYMFSEKTAEGEQLKKGFGGFAAILRYR